VYFFAIDTTSRRFASTSSHFGLLGERLTPAQLAREVPELVALHHHGLFELADLPELAPHAAVELGPGLLLHARLFDDFLAALLRGAAHLADHPPQIVDRDLRLAATRSISRSQRDI
jgi:hypothetical protein